MVVSQLIAISDASGIGEARRLCASLAKRAEGSDTEQGRIAIVATEMATNLVRHSGGGDMIATLVPSAEGYHLEILSLDKGPGMTNVARCLEDGYSTSGTPGNGLGAMQRLASSFDIYSQLELGTAVLARFNCRTSSKAKPVDSAFSFGAVCLPYPGETHTGDACAFVSPDGDTMCLNILLADGLGHGIKAAEAAEAAVAGFANLPGEASPREILQTLHTGLYGTRGAAVAVTRMNAASRQIRFAGVGNIGASLFVPDGKSQGMPSHSGIVGHQQIRLNEYSYTWQEAGVLVMYSDGLLSRWNLQRYPGLWLHDASLIAGVLYRDFKRGRDDATVVVVKDRSR